jgi:hypothetical protein
MISSIMLGVALVIILLCAGVSALRGFGKTVLRTGTILLSALAAIITCLVLKAQLPDAAGAVTWIETNADTIRQFVGESDFADLVANIKELSVVSPTLVELVVQLLGALVAPLLCLILFFVFCLITGIIYFIVKLIIRGPLKLLNKIVPMSRLCAAGLGLVEGIIIVGMIFLPVTAYMSVAAPAMDGLVEQGVMDAEDPDTQTVLDIVDEIEESPVVVTHGILGGKLIGGSLTSVKVAGETVNLEKELDPIMGLLNVMTELGETEMQNYTEHEAELIRSLGEDFGRSKLLAPIVGDVLFAATDAWQRGEEFMGAPKPDMGEASELFGPFMDTLLDILHDDAKNPDLLKKDIQTFADVIAILAKSGVMANLENTDELLATLGGDGVVKSMITALGENESMKRLIPEVTNLGVRAIGQVLNIPENVESVYGDFMDDVAGALNSVADLPADQQIDTLTSHLTTAFGDAGVAIDAEILDFYSASMIQDLVENNDGEVTAADVQAFFLIYSENVVENSPSASNGRPSMDMLSTSDDPLAGTIYAGMTEEQLQNTAIAKLAKFCCDLSELNAADAEFSAKAQALVDDTFADILGNEVFEELKKKELTKALSADSIQNTAGLKSVDAMKLVSTVITLDKLLIDTKAAADKLNAEGIQLEADAIAAIFDAAGNLTGSLNGEGFNVTELAGTVGAILDALSKTDSFGKDNTAKLFTAILQSETVRDAAGLDMETATQMANKATSGDGSYTQTMNTVAGSLGLAEKLGNGEEISDDELVELIQNLNPQTAGMLEIYMTPARMEDMGVPADDAAISSQLLTAIFSYMGRDDLANYEKEAKGLNTVLQMAMSAQDSDSNKLFSTSDTAKDGVLPTAATTVSSVMDSEAISYALVEVLTDGQKVTTVDPYELGSEIEDEVAEQEAFLNAIRNHKSNNPSKNPLAYEALAAMFNLKLN